MADDLLPPAGAVTQQDIAAACGVSLGTVSLALRGDPRISAATARRVREVAETLGYDPTQHQAARRLALRKHGRDVLNRVIGLVAPTGFHRPGYFSELMAGILEELVPAGFCTLTMYIYDQREACIPVAMRAGNIDAVLTLASDAAVTPVISQLRGAAGFGARPVVSLIWAPPGCAVVRVDDEGAGYALARHLLEQGHRYLVHFCFIFTPHIDQEPQGRRIAGARRALREFGLDPDRHLLVVDLDHQHWIDPTALLSDDPRLQQVRLPDTSYLPLAQLFRDRPEFTALLALNDPSALRAWRLLEAAGFRVPEDISVAGFDDTYPHPGPDGENQLTSVAVPLAAIGREGARLALRQIDAGQADPVEVVVPAEVRLRASTARVVG
jgi:DNA-binding LacI/PurR family transcriptional regulator